MDFVAKELRLLKKDVLLPAPEGVGRRDRGYTDTVELEVESPAGVRPRLNVLEVNLVRASEKEDFRSRILARIGWPELSESSASSAIAVDLFDQVS